MTAPLLPNLLLPVLVSVIVEAAGMAAFSLLYPGQRPHLVRNVLLNIALSIVSHTLAGLTLPLMPIRAAPAVCGYGFFVVFIEGFVYASVYRLPPIVAALLSLALNLAAFIVTVLIWGWPV